MTITDYSWRANALDKLHGTFRDPLEKKNFKPEDIGQADIFIRELVQNALDAKRQSASGPVRVCIKTVDFDSDQSLRDAYLHLLTPTLKGYLVDSEDISADYNYSFKGILISDYGTKGLSGRAKDQKENWWKYFYKVGQGKGLSKQDSLGSANQGKVAIWALSRIWTVICRSHVVGIGETRLMGKALLKAAVEISEDEMRVCDAYFAKSPSPSDDLIKLEPEDCVWTDQIFGTRGDQDYGSDFLLLEATELNHDDLIVAVLKNWSIPIAEEKLILEIETTIIDGSTYRSLCDQFSNRLGLLDNEMIDFCLDAANDKAQLKLALKENLTQSELKKNTLSPQWLSEATTPKVISRALQDKKLIELKVPVLIKKRGSQDFTAYFKIYLRERNHDGFNEGSHGLMMRGYQVLGSETAHLKAAKYKSNLMLLVSSRNIRLNELLTYYEESSHLKFNKNNLENGSGYVKNASDFVLDLFRNMSNKFLNLILESELDNDPNFLRQLFPNMALGQEEEENDEEEDDDDEDLPPGDDPPPPPPPPSSPAALKMRQSGGLIRITSTSSFNLEEDVTFKVELAVFSGSSVNDSFRKTSSFDFNLSREPISFEANNCEANALDVNTLLLKPLSKDFDLKISGFHPHWAYVMRYTIVLA